MLARFTYVIIICFLITVAADNALALQPEEIAVIVNSDHEHSVAVGRYYCEKRGLPQTNIIALPMSRKEIISRNEYQQKIVPGVREFLNQPGRKGKIKCLLTIYGVPLRIQAYVPQGRQRQWRDLIDRYLDQYFGELLKVKEDFQTLINPLYEKNASNGTEKPFRLPRGRLPREKKAIAILRQTLQVAENVQKKIGDKHSFKNHEKIKKQFKEINRRWRGLEGILAELKNQYQQTINAEEKQNIERQIAVLQNQLQKQALTIQKNSGSEVEVSRHENRYKAFYEAGGGKLLCNILIKDRRKIGDEDSESSLDSELSLVLWPEYPLGEQQPNLLRAYEPPVMTVKAPAGLEAPTLMVARLDGPKLSIAKGLVDKALEAEKKLLRGRVYIDARGMYKNKDKFGSYAYFDDLLRMTGEYLKKHTPLQVLVDNQPQLFGVGKCPDTVLYCGWYKLQTYVNSFTYRTGAVGFHIASLEAQTLRPSRAGSKLNNVWCKRMLEEGVTATLGAVAEPYLYSFVRPDLFFADLVGGKYCLVECYYRSKPFNSWMFTLIGDPLYRPRYAKIREKNESELSEKSGLPLEKKSKQEKTPALPMQKKKRATTAPPRGRGFKPAY